MEKFGFVSPLLLEPTSWYQLTRLLPEKWRYLRGPLKLGEISGLLDGIIVKGWAWKTPANPLKVWDDHQKNEVWETFLTEIEAKEIKVLGLDWAALFHPPFKLMNSQKFPGISDGKALELVFFMNRFRRLLRNYGIMPQRAKAVIVWEEGNLGITCARLVAREVRFLTLVNPNLRLLERAADLVMAETGVSAQLKTELAVENVKILIKCGSLSKYPTINSRFKRLIFCELFARIPSLTSINYELPVNLYSRIGQLPLYPALSEAVLRSTFGFSSGFWYGPELPLERVFKLAGLLKDLGLEVAI